jgi:phosphoribosylformimino-5-aminoimidazole carboxamide ribotide isomerase
MDSFDILPAVDLRQGQVVRLRQGDPGRQTVYGSDPAAAARRWLEEGARWLHVVNLDGAFGEGDGLNRAALLQILTTASEFGAQVQFGGGLRTRQAVAEALELGVRRVVLGTMAVEQPKLLRNILDEFGPERAAVGIDARAGQVQVRGWQAGSNLPAVDLAALLAAGGLRWLVFTDIARDGEGAGLNLAATQELAQISRLSVIASGGAAGAEDVRRAREAGLAGVILGRSLYEGRIALGEVLC